MLSRVSEGGVDGYVARHVGERETDGAVAPHHAACMFAGGVDGAGSNQVPDGGAVGVAEGSAEFGIGGMVDGKGVAVAVENAAKCVVDIRAGLCAHQAAGADVMCHQEVLFVVAFS